MDLRRTLNEHLKARALQEQALKMQNKYRDILKDELEAHGEEDAEGHRWFYFPDPEAGEEGDPFYAPDGGLVHSIKREKRESISLDEDKAEEILKELGLLERCQETIVVLDEDAILSLNFSGELSDEALQQMYGEPKVTYAFKVDKDKPE